MKKNHTSEKKINRFSIYLKKIVITTETELRGTFIYIFEEIEPVSLHT